MWRAVVPWHDGTSSSIGSLDVRWGESIGTGGVHNNNHQWRHVANNYQGNFGEAAADFVLRRCNAWRQSSLEASTPKLLIMVAFICKQYWFLGYNITMSGKSFTQMHEVVLECLSQGFVVAWSLVQCIHLTLDSCKRQRRHTISKKLSFLVISKDSYLECGRQGGCKSIQCRCNVVMLLQCRATTLQFTDKLNTAQTSMP